MCGFFVSNFELDDGEIDAALRRHLIFRGPDHYSGVQSYNGWHVAHARLSIIETSDHSNQPFVTDSGVLLYNGEIFNYAELSQKYGLNAGRSDTAVLAELIDRNLLDFAELDGFFAIVYLDIDGKLRHCARDRFGVKPLYFFRNGDRISICSEPKVLQVLHGLPVSKTAIEDYLNLRAPVSVPSFFEGVDQVRKGTCLVNGLYFDLHKFLEQTKGALGSTKQLEATIKKKIESRLVSDVECGLLFSGGIDSNLIDQLSNTRLQKYSAVSRQQDNIDYRWAHQHGAQCLDIGDEEFRETLWDMLKTRGEPLSVPNEVSLARLAQIAASDGIKVLLSGEAADEFFAGYDRIYGYFAEHNFDVELFVKQYAYSSQATKNKRLMSFFEDYFDRFSGLDAFEKVRHFFVDVHLPILFRRLDFALMYAGVEGREPLATPEVLAIASGYSKSDLMVEKLGKHPLRTVVERYLGTDFAFGEKVGFPIETARIFSDFAGETGYQKWQNANLRELGWL